MSTATSKRIALLIVAVALTITSAFARDHRREHRRERERHERIERRVEHRRWEDARAREHRRHERERWAAEHRRDERRPNGWEHGRKTGWGDHDVPPGQLKKDSRDTSFHGPAHGGSDHQWSGNHNQPNSAPPRDSQNSGMRKLAELKHKK